MAAATSAAVGLKIPLPTPPANSSKVCAMTSTGIGPNKKTPTDASVAALIGLAHHLGMRVFLNPFVNSMQGSGWQAEFHPTSTAKWFHSFDRYLTHYAKLAQREHADLFAIGDEFDTLDNVPALEPDWAKAIATARRYYHGPITYGADYTHYQSVTFWKLLDDVGIDAYFPLSSTSNPGTADLKAAWSRQADSIEAWRERTGLAGRGFLVTELGYPSEDGAGQAPGTWYPHQPVNLGLQQKLYQATFQSLWQKPWVRGVMWFWWANPSNPHWQGGPGDNGNPAHSVVTPKTPDHAPPGAPPCDRSSLATDQARHIEETRTRLDLTPPGSCRGTRRPPRAATPTAPRARPKVRARRRPSSP